MPLKSNDRDTKLPEGGVPMAFVKLMASLTGRLVRMVAGSVLIVVGLLVVQDAGGIVLAIIGLVPLLAGLLDFCVFAPLFGAPLSGKAIRSA
jgi:hypothetical protein